MNLHSTCLPLKAVKKKKANYKRIKCLSRPEKKNDYKFKCFFNHYYLKKQLQKHPYTMLLLLSNSAMILTVRYPTELIFSLLNKN